MISILTIYGKFELLFPDLQKSCFPFSISHHSMTFDHSEKHFGCIQQSQSCKTFPPIVTLEFCSRLSQLKLYFRIVKTSLPSSSCVTKCSSTTFQCFYPHLLLSNVMKCTRGSVHNFLQCLILIGTR